MGILDGIVAWIAEQIMHGLDLISTSVLGALGCNMDIFLRYFPAAETMYTIFVALAIGLTTGLQQALKRKTRLSFPFGLSSLFYWCSFLTKF